MKNSITILYTAECDSFAYRGKDAFPLVRPIEMRDTVCVGASTRVVESMHYIYKVCKGIV